MLAGIPRLDQRHHVQIALVLLRIVAVGAILFQPRHFLREIEFGAALGFHEPDYFIRRAHDEVRRVVGKVAIGFDVIQLEADGEIIFGVRLHVGRGFEKPGEGEFKAAGVRLADDAVEDGFAGVEVGPVFGAERARVAQLDVAVNARRAGFLHGEGVDGGFERVVKNFARVRLGKIPQHDRVFQIHRRRREKKVAHEVAHFRIKHLVAADEPQVFQQLPRKERNDGAVIRRARAVERDGVMNFRVEHLLENNLAGFFGCE